MFQGPSFYIQLCNPTCLSVNRTRQQQSKNQSDSQSCIFWGFFVCIPWLVLCSWVSYSDLFISLARAAWLYNCLNICIWISTFYLVPRCFKRKILSGCFCPVDNVSHIIEINKKIDKKLFQFPDFLHFWTRVLAVRKTWTEKSWIVLDLSSFDPQCFLRLQLQFLCCFLARYDVKK